MSKFKVGDKVKRLAPYQYFIAAGGVVGKIYTVTAASDFSISLDEIKSNMNNFEANNFELVEQKTVFQAGDKVRIKGGQDIWIIKESPLVDSGIVKISFGLTTIYFKISLLELVERPKKLVKKTFEAWLHIYPLGHKRLSFNESDPGSLHGERNACIKLTGEAEVPEND